MASATLRGSAASVSSGRPWLTLQKAQSRVQRSPRNHKGCGSPAPALALIGACGAAAYRMEAMRAMEALNTGVIRTGLEADLEPFRFNAADCQW